MGQLSLQSVNEASIVTIEASLWKDFNAPTGTEARPIAVLPEWDAHNPGERASRGVLDTLIRGMASVGRSVQTISLYLGLGEHEVRERVPGLGLAPAAGKPLRRPSAARPWSVGDVRGLIALWLDNVSAGSIAEAFGRSRSGVHGKRRWLGLSIRDRKRVGNREAEACRGVALPWRPTFDVSAIVARLFQPRPCKLLPEASPPPRSRVEWVLGRDREKDERFSILGFGGLRPAAIAKRMLIEFGVNLSDSAVNSRMTRLQIVRERGGRPGLTSEYDAEEVERRAREAMTRLGATLGQCAGLHRSFWYCRAIGGNRSTCREFDSKKFQKRKAERSWSDALGMAA